LESPEIRLGVKYGQEKIKRDGITKNIEDREGQKKTKPIG
jgi:hypothetical protein